jgi:hypothetical protein
MRSHSDHCRRCDSCLEATDFTLKIWFAAKLNCVEDVPITGLARNFSRAVAKFYWLANSRNRTRDGVPTIQRGGMNRRLITLWNESLVKKNKPARSVGAPTYLISCSTKKVKRFKESATSFCHPSSPRVPQLPLAPRPSARSARGMARRSHSPTPPDGRILRWLIPRRARRRFQS